MTRKAQQGFTLIELMIVLAIIGVLASFALPAYQKYVVRTRVSEGLVMASAAKNHVMEILNAGAAANGFNKGFDNSNLDTRNISSMSIDNDNGVITLQTTVAAGNGKLVLVPYVSQGTATAPLSANSNATEVKWKCLAQGATSVAGIKVPQDAIVTDLAPAECR